MSKLCYILLLLILFSCSSSEEHLEKIEFTRVNLDSLFQSADATIEQINNQKKEKVLLEQDLWRKKRDIKKIEQKYTDSIWSLSNMYELQTLKVDTDSTVYNYKIVLREIVDTVRLTVTDSVCSVCLAKQNKRDNRFYKKAFRWIQKIEL